MGAFAALGFAQPVMAQDDAVVLAPTSEWMLDRAEHSCTIRRSFGDAKNVTWLEMRKASPFGGDYRFTITTNQFTTTGQVPLAYFSPAGEPEIPDLRLYEKAGDRGSVAFFMGVQSGFVADRSRAGQPLSPEEADAATDQFRTAITGLRVEAAFDKTLLLQTGEMRGPLATAEKCIEDLMTSWGVDPKHAMGESRTIASDGHVLWNEELLNRVPETLRRRGKETRVVFPLVVGADGVPTACWLDQPFVEEGYENWACKLILHNARYTPALDKDGKPMRAIYAVSAFYSGIEPAVPPETVARAIVDAIKSNDQASFDSLIMGDAARYYGAREGQAPSYEPLTFAAVREAFAGCKFRSPRRVLPDMVALETRCGRDKEDRLSHLMVRDGKVQIFYKFMYYIVMLR